MEMIMEKDNNPVTEIHCRFGSRVNYSLEIFYPIINNTSVYKDYAIDSPLMIAVNVSESGICFNSIVPVKVGDFISFMIQIGDNPSFWCLSEVKWIEEKQTHQYIGCQFYMLSDACLSIIKNYVKTTLSILK